MTPGSKDQPAATPESKPRKNIFNTILAIVVLLIVIMIIGIVLITLQGGDKDQVNTLTVVNETQIVTTHLSVGNASTSKVLLLDQYAGKSLKNTQLNMVEQYYNGNNGTLIVTNVVSNTPGFKIVAISPSLPVTIPNAPSMDAGNVSIKVTYDYPSLPYTGPFNYTVYFDYYPEIG
ncbi:MAG TPA: hypothetical protein VGK13_05485 [Methanocellaceae archaeon]|jgi:hypothetical protein